MRITSRGVEVDIVRVVRDHDDGDAEPSRAPLWRAFGADGREVDYLLVCWNTLAWSALRGRYSPCDCEASR